MQSLLAVSESRAHEGLTELLREQGLDSCPQEFLSMYAKIIKDFLGVPDKDYIFFCGIAIGWRDDDAKVNGFPRERVDLDEQAKFLGWN